MKFSGGGMPWSPESTAEETLHVTADIAIALLLTADKIKSAFITSHDATMCLQKNGLWSPLGSSKQHAG